MKTSALHPRFGVEVHDIQLADINADSGYPEIRALFEEHSLLFFRQQQINDKQHLKLAALFGPREDRTIDPVKPNPKISLVSSVREDGQLYQAHEKRMQDMQSNFLWHTDSTFLPVPALANLLIGRVIPDSGSSTEFATTRAAWDDMPEALKAQIKDCYFIHDFTHSRRKINPDLAEDITFTHWGQRVWKSLWKNPVIHKEAIYIASHVCGIVGMDQEKALALVDEVIAWCTQDKYVYAHQWAVDDVLIWDERATLHRGVAWDYSQPRTLSSVCVSVSDADGFGQMQ